MTGRIWQRTLIAAALAGALGAAAGGSARAAEGDGLWSVYNDALKSAKYVDLTHTITPDIPVWSGFADSTFAPARAGADIEGYAKKGDIYTYDKHGFEATEYHLSTDQLGTQLDPPAHWAPEYPAIDELPATYAIRPLVVISIVDQVKSDPNYALKVADIEAWEKKHGKHPGRLRRLRALRLVEGLAGPEARHPEGVSRRLARRSEVPARRAPHPVPRP